MDATMAAVTLIVMLLVATLGYILGLLAGCSCSSDVDEDIYFTPDWDDDGED